MEKVVCEESREEDESPAGTAMGRAVRGSRLGGRRAGGGECG